MELSGRGLLIPKVKEPLRMSVFAVYGESSNDCHGLCS